MAPVVLVVYPEAQCAELYAPAGCIFLCECPGCGAQWRGVTGPDGGAMPCYRCDSVKTSITEIPAEEEEDDHGDPSLN